MFNIRMIHILREKMFKIDRLMLNSFISKAENLDVKHLSKAQKCEPI